MLNILIECFLVVVSVGRNRVKIAIVSFFCFLALVSSVSVVVASTESNSSFEERLFHMHDEKGVFYVIGILSNSTVSDFYFHYALKKISFYINGTAGTKGVCNVTIPSGLMSGEFTVYEDGSQLIKNTNYAETFNGTHYLFTITYEHSTHLIEIVATDDIPEFPAWTVLPLCLTAILFTLIFRKRTSQSVKKRSESDSTEDCNVFCSFFHIFSQFIWVEDAFFGYYFGYQVCGNTFKAVF
jgi:hypothetical protein